MDNNTKKREAASFRYEAGQMKEKVQRWRSSIIQHENAEKARVNILFKSELTIEEQSKRTEMKRALVENLLGKQIVSTARALEEFIGTEDGQTALQLLKVSNGNVKIAAEEVGDGFTTFYLFSACGFLQCTEPTKSYGNLCNHLSLQTFPRPICKKILPREFVEAAVVFGSVAPELIIPRLLEELDKIAANSPEVK